MWIEIFKTGAHTDSSGRSENYTAESLDRIAGLYNSKTAESASYEAPLVKGHPETDAPAYGWVEKLARRGDRLLAKLKDLAPELVDEVRKGMFRKVSLALYPDMLLRHIGFLGAAAPAVKGLKTVSFTNGRSFKEYESAGIDIISEDKNESEKDEQAVRIELLGKNYSELEVKHKELEAKISEYEAKISLLEKESRLNEFREFANSMIESPEGSIITPAQADNLIDILEMAHCSDRNSTSAKTFTDEFSNVEKVKSFISALKPVFSAKEFAAKAISNTHQEIDDFSSRNVSEERLQLHEKAKQIREQTPGISYEEAVCLAQREFGF